MIGRFLLSKISVELKRDLHPIGAQVPLAIFGYSSMTSNIIRAPSLKLFWKIRQDLIVRTLQNTLTTDNINRAEDGESQLKRVFIKIVDDLGVYYKIGLNTDFTGKLFNEMYSWLGFTQDQLNDVVLTPPYVATLLCRLARVNKDSFVWDFATGSAGLLVAAMNEMLADAKKKIKSPEELARKSAEIKANQLLGLEILSNVYMLAVLNMIMMGDGSSNILNKDSLKFDGHYGFGKTDEKFPADAFILNPPYSAEGNGMIFVEKALSMMDKGYAAIIIQNSAGSGNAVEYNKSVLTHSTLLASVRMPIDLFVGKSSVQTHKKVKAVMKQKGESGEYLTTNPPYGYMKDPDNPKRHWIVDDEAAAVVRQIFAWCMAGFGPSQIAKKLKEAKVDCPTVHWMKMGRNAPAKTPDNPYDWAPRTITGILEKQEYLGHMVNFKTRKQSYKSKKKIENPPEQWKIFENTHEAIIDEETFTRVQELRKNKRRPARTGKTNMFSGLVRCADCGEKLYYCTSNSFETRQDHFVCSTSRKKGKEVCDTHFIRAVVLEEGTLQHMRLVIQCVADYEDAFRRALGAKRSEEAKKDLSAKKRTLQKSENRLAELDRLFKRIYEDMVNGKLSEARFQMLSDDYEQEQADLRVKIEMLENEIQNQEDQAENVDRFIRQAKKYLYLEKLTPTILNDMVNAVYVHAPDKSSGHRVQDVTISYNYIGILPANLLYDVMNGKAA